MGLLQTFELNCELRSMSGIEASQQYAHATARAFQSTDPEAIPVIICALNEEDDIAATLVGLSKSETPLHPIVVDNGSQDATQDIAAHMGATVLEEPFPSKMKAQQLGIEYALEEVENHQTLLFTDADTIVTPLWAESMLKGTARLGEEQGGLLFGHVAFTHGESRTTNIVRNVVHAAKQVKSRLTTEGVPVAHGANTAIKLDGNANIETSLRNLPASAFPQDMAVRDSVIAAGGLVKANLSVHGVAFTRGDRYQSFREYLDTRSGAVKTVDLYRDEYGENHIAYSESTVDQTD